MDDFLSRLASLQGEMNTSAFARLLGINQKTLDHLVKGERKPSVEIVIAVCTKMHVSANWLLGLPETKSAPKNTDSTARLECLCSEMRALLEKYSS